MDAFDFLGGPNLRGRGRPRIREPTNNNNRAVGRPKIYGDLPRSERVKLAGKTFQAKKKEKKRKETLRKQERIKRQREELKTTFKRKEQNKLQILEPSQSSFKSYNEYTINNDYPDMIPIQNITNDEVGLLYLIGSSPPLLPSNQIRAFIYFYNIKRFLKNKIGFKVYLSIDLKVFKTLPEGFEINKLGCTSKSKLIRNDDDINEVIEHLITEYESITYLGSSKSSLKPYTLKSLKICVAKVNSLTGSSYIQLPEWIANKKACINIKNEDNLCFVYSVLCAIETPKIHPERVSHYKNRLKELKYKDDDMAMCINKIRYFEKNNNIKINVFSTDRNKRIDPLYISEYNSIDFKEVDLLYIKDEEKSHYVYIKDLNKLCSNDNDKNKVLICRKCLNFRASGGSAEMTLINHQKFCISGQRCCMPEQDEIKFRHYSYLIPEPIFICADFETLGNYDKKETSKNGNTTFNKSHDPASFKLTIISQIPFKGYEKIIDNQYTKSIKAYGLECAKDFVRYMEQLERELGNDIYESQYQNKYFDHSTMTPQEQEEYYKCKECKLCKCSFTSGNKKVRHHNHNTGKYISPLCSNCNIKIKAKVRIPVIFHNLNYDKNVFFKHLVSYYEQRKQQIEDKHIATDASTFSDDVPQIIIDGYNERNKNSKDKKINAQVNILPNNENNFKSFTVGKLAFIDSFAHLPSGLESLINNVPDDDKHFLRSLCNTEEEFKLMNKKGFFPYDWFDTIDKLNMPIEDLRQHHFNNSMKKEKLTDADWLGIKHLIKKLNMKTFKDYHDYYLDIDVAGHIDVIRSYREISMKHYQLDPLNYVGTPSFGWDAMLLKTGVELELLKDIEMYLFYEKGIRGGQSVIFQKFCKGNNKYLSDYDPKLKNIFISYLDANNLYGWAMSKKLPISGFKWIEPLTEDFIMNYNDDSDLGYTLEVDLHYPKELHDLHNDYPLAPERKKLGQCEKLCGTFYDKINYVVDIRNLKFYLEKGMKLIKVNRVIQYNCEAWLKPWIDLNTSKRKVAKNDFEKDYFKLMNNSVFGKTMENVRGRIDLKMAFDDEYQKKYQSKPNYKTTTPYDDFSIIQLSKTSVKLDKPIYAGFSILDLSKLHMYDFHYNVMKPKYGDKIELLMTDTDSFVYKIETDDFYKDMYEDKEYYDMSEYDKDYQYYDETNKKVLGMFKDEKQKSTISEFVGVRPKCYSMMCNDGDNTKKLKGVPKITVKKDIIHNDYKKCVLEYKKLTVQFEAIRCKSKELTNYSLTQSKNALSNTDDKRVWNGIESLAYGHYKLE